MGVCQIESRAPDEMQVKARSARLLGSVSSTGSCVHDWRLSKSCCGTCWQVVVVYGSELRSWNMSRSLTSQPIIRSRSSLLAVVCHVQRYMQADGVSDMTTLQDWSMQHFACSCDLLTITVCCDGARSFFPLLPCKFYSKVSFYEQLNFVGCSRFTTLLLRTDAD